MTVSMCEITELWFAEEEQPLILISSVKVARHHFSPKGKASVVPGEVQGAAY